MRQRPITFVLASLLACVTLLVSLLSVAAPAAAVANIDEVVDQLNATRVYVEDGADADTAAIAAAVSRAQGAGINAYAVVLADDGAGIKAQNIQAALPDNATVLLYTPTLYDFESRDICPARFDEARSTADSAITTGSASAGVDAFVTALIAIPADPDCAAAGDSGNADGSGNSGSSFWRWLLIALAALFLIALLWTLYKVLAGSRRRQREEQEFEERRRILKDWAGTLRAPVTELQPHVAAAKSSSLATMYNDALKVARESEGNLDRATAIPDLDAAEIRIARAQMQIRDVRKGLLRD